MPRLVLALPSKGAIAEPTLSFLSDCGLRVDKPNPRQYTGTIPAIPGVDVLFQRVIDVFYKVADGTAQVGITGLDIIRENETDSVIVLNENLGYGRCRLVVAVPDAWIDVDNMFDLADVALDFRELRSRPLRVATTYPNLTRRFLHNQGIHHFIIVNAEGAIEAAPMIGAADIVVDLVQTGTTLRENRLKPLDDGVILESQACLVFSASARRERKYDPQTVRSLLEHVDGALQGRSYSQLTANVLAVSAGAIGQVLIGNPVTRGLRGPTIAPIEGAESTNGLSWFSVTIIVPDKQLLPAIDHLRHAGGTQVSVIPVRYIFQQASATFATHFALD